MSIDGELRSIRAVARRVREGDIRPAHAMMLDQAARNIGRSVDFLRAESAGHLPAVQSQEKYDGLTVAEALALLSVRAQECIGDDESLIAEMTACGEALKSSLSPSGGSPGSLPPPDADSPGAVRRDARRTSQEAALAILPKTGGQRARLLAELWNVARFNPQQPGLTDVELARLTGMRDNSVRPRRVELVRGGWVEDTGKTKPHHGGEHTVWALTEKARTELARG